MWQGRGKTAIAGIGYSAISRRPQKPLGLLAVDACRAAIADAGLDAGQIDGLATYPESPFAGAGNRDGEDVVSVDYIINHLPLAPDIRWYAQIETGMIASPIIEADECANRRRLRICIGLARAPSARARAAPAAAPAAIGRAARGRRCAIHGALRLPATIMQWHALAWQRYMHRYGATREALAALALNSRRNANLNPRAFFYKEPMSRDDYFNSRWIAEPMCLFDCDVPVDGCVALILTTAERARDLRNPPAYIAGYGQNTARRRTLFHYALDDYMACGGSLAKKLWYVGRTRSAVTWTPRNFTTASILRRSIGWRRPAFAREGEGGAFVRDGRIALEGELPVNTFGGSLSEGRMHGMGHIAEAVRQVTGRAEQRQIPGAAAVCAIDGSPMLAWQRHRGHSRA